MGSLPAHQASFHVPYLYAAIGQPWKTEYWTRRACTELFNAPRTVSAATKKRPPWQLVSAQFWAFLPPDPPQPVRPHQPDVQIRQPSICQTAKHLRSPPRTTRPQMCTSDPDPERQPDTTLDHPIQSQTGEHIEVMNDKAQPAHSGLSMNFLLGKKSKWRRC